MNLHPDDQPRFDVALMRLETLALAIRQQPDIDAAKVAIVRLWDAIVPTLELAREVEQHTRAVAVREHEEA